MGEAYRYNVKINDEWLIQEKDVIAKDFTDLMEKIKHDIWDKLDGIKITRYNLIQDTWRKR